MAKMELIIPHILQWEGGFVDHKDDKGGATMKGVTLNTYRNFFGEDKTVEQLKNISDEQWGIIFKKGYWDKCKADDINSQSVANLLVDFAYNSGYSRANKYIQEIVGVSVDGIVGPKSLKAINDTNSYILFEKLWNKRKAFYETIVKNNPSQKVFMKGWMNRLNSIKYND